VYGATSSRSGRGCGPCRASRCGPSSAGTRCPAGQRGLQPGPAADRASSRRDGAVEQPVEGAPGRVDPGERAGLHRVAPSSRSRRRGRSRRGTRTRRRGERPAPAVRAAIEVSRTDPPRRRRSRRPSASARGSRPRRAARSAMPSSAPAGRARGQAALHLRAFCSPAVCPASIAAVSLAAVGDERELHRTAAVSSCRSPAGGLHQLDLRGVRPRSSARSPSRRGPRRRASSTASVTCAFVGVPASRQIASIERSSRESSCAAEPQRDPHLLPRVPERGLLALGLLDQPRLPGALPLSGRRVLRVAGRSTRSASR
jgi:hypothetical protein